jgi:23S rRNA pseudouridine1911/1915/1917 synthase
VSNAHSSPPATYESDGETHRDGRLRYDVPEEATKLRVDAWLAAQIAGVTRGMVQRWIAEGRVLLDEQPCRPKDRLRSGMRIVVDPGPEQASQAEPDPDVVVDAVHEDEHLIVVNKPAGLVVHPGKGHFTGTLVNGLLARPGFERPSIDPHDPAGYLRPGIVHRIDKDTSGLLVVAKSAQAREGLKAQLAAHTVERVYSALTVGLPAEGRISTLHGRDPQNRLRFSSLVPDGKVAVTNVKVIESLGRGNAALVECRLETGRTHQIRVHLSIERKTPILADELYGGYRVPQSMISLTRALGRQALHAGVLGFLHPVTRVPLRFSAPLPADIQEAYRALQQLG